MPRDPSDKDGLRATCIHRDPRLKESFDAVVDLMAKVAAKQVFEETLRDDQNRRKLNPDSEPD